MLIEKHEHGVRGHTGQQDALVLTMLGIIIGIGSVISIVSIGDTMRNLFPIL